MSSLSRLMMFSQLSLSPSVNGRRLGDDDVLPVVGRDVVQVELELGQRAVPVAVERGADHVEGDVAGGDVVKPPAEGPVVAALGEMEHHLRRG
jgi:hypothetical protein